MIPPLIDPFGRRIDYLRVSVTDRCNFRCVYCMPEEGFPCTPKEETLTAEELRRLVAVAATLGIRKVRLTGGEPLLLKGLVDLVAAVSPLVEDLSVTTNGFRLAEMAADLARAGLRRANVSLDTRDTEKFVRIARRGRLDTVLEGIAAAQAAGLTPLKVNVVAMRGVNDDEAADFAAWTRREEIHVRFIELMPMRWSLDEGPAMAERGLLPMTQTRGGMLSDLEMRRMAITAGELRERIESELGPLMPAQVATNGPARTFRLAGAKGTVGFISQISNDFCTACNRLRLTHDGYLRPCLMSDGELDLRTPLRDGASDDDLRSLFRFVVQNKPERHFLDEGQRVVGRGMSQIGG